MSTDTASGATRVTPTPPADPTAAPVVTYRDAQPTLGGRTLWSHLDLDVVRFCDAEIDRIDHDAGLTFPGPCGAALRRCR